MSANTKIEWADHTFNPWLGCTKVGPGCDNCYAKADFEDRKHRVVWGAGQARSRTSAANWALPVRWNKRAGVMQSAWAHGVDLHGGDEAACIAAGFIKPRRPKVFCASLADVFDNEVPVAWRMDLFNLIADTPNLDWLILTKRIGNVMPMCSGDSLMFDMICERVWLGATIVNQEEADRDIPKLLAVPAAKRFLSMEPLLWSVNLSHLNEDKETNEFDCLKPFTWEQEIEQWRDTEDDWEESFEDHYGVTLAGLSGPMHAGIDWIIVGGESGPNARPMHPDWVRSLRDQCQAAGVPFLFKQWGEFLPASADEGDPTIADVSESRLFWSDGSKWDRFDGQRAGVDLVARLGKKAAGRLLDGREWNGVPA
jgi:protein gp37